MAYCTNCGKELRDGDKFCSHCGEPVREAEKELEVRKVNNEESINKRKFPMLAGATTAIVIVLIIAISVVFSNRSGNRDTEDAGKAAQKESAKYEIYSNNEVHFSVEYPENYMVTEPGDNNVLITEGEKADFQVTVEYAYSTPKNSMIYSAKDFDDQVSSNANILTDWLGTEKVKVTDYKKGKLAGRDSYEYDFELEIEGSKYTGQLSVVDGDGQFGCYSFMSVINEEAEDAPVYKEQSEAMKESFEITGAYQPEGYTIYNYDDLDMQFAVRDEAMGQTKMSGGSVVVYPVEGVYSEASIWIDESSYSEKEKDAASVLKVTCDGYFTGSRQGKYTSQPEKLECGRYPCTSIEAEYSDKGETFRLSVFTFVHDGKYWQVKMKSTEENYEMCKKAVSDILYSIRFSSFGQPEFSKITDSEGDDYKGGEASADTEGLIADIINNIESRSEYVTDSMWKPLAVTDDFNGDGVQEFLCVYELKSGGAVDVMYDVWSLGKSGADKIRSEVLFREVGGNSGVVGIIRSGGEAYLAVCRYEPQGEQFNDYYIYYPWEPKESRLGESVVYLERHGIYGQEEKGKYIMGDTVVDKSKFDARYRELDDWVYQLDILAGAGTDGVMTFDDMKNF